MIRKSIQVSWQTPGTYIIIVNYDKYKEQQNIVLYENWDHISNSRNMTTKQVKIII